MRRGGGGRRDDGLDGVRFFGKFRPARSATPNASAACAGGEACATDPRSCNADGTGFFESECSSDGGTIVESGQSPKHYASSDTAKVLRRTDPELAAGWRRSAASGFPSGTICDSQRTYQSTAPSDVIAGSLVDILEPRRVDGMGPADFPSPISLRDRIVSEGTYGDADDYDTPSGSRTVIGSSSPTVTKPAHGSCPILPLNREIIRHPMNMEARRLVGAHRMTVALLTRLVTEACGNGARSWRCIRVRFEATSARVASARLRRRLADAVAYSFGCLVACGTLQQGR